MKVMSSTLNTAFSKRVLAMALEREGPTPKLVLLS